MDKTVTDADFDRYYSDVNNRNIIFSVCSRFSNTLSTDILESCGMVGLWKCIKSHDSSYNRKFTSSLYTFVKWECLRELNNHKRQSFFIQTSDPVEAGFEEKSDEILEYVEMLPLEQQVVIQLKFYENCTLDEIGTKRGYTKEAARQYVNKGVARLGELCSSSYAFGV